MMEHVFELPIRVSMMTDSEKNLASVTFYHDNINFTWHFPDVVNSLTFPDSRIH